jgi:hypothetical protein
VRQLRNMHSCCRRASYVEKRCHLAILQVPLEKRQSAVGKLRFDCSSRGMCFKRNRTGLVLRQPDSGHEDPIGIEAVLEDPVILMPQFEALRWPDMTDLTQLFKTAPPAAKKHSQRHARSGSCAVHSDQSPTCAAAARPEHRCSDRRYLHELASHAADARA